MPTERGRLLPFVAVGLGLLAILAVILLAWYLNRDTLPARPATFSMPEKASPAHAYDVKEAGANGLVLASRDGSAELRVGVPASVEVIAPAPAATIAVGDWVNVVGIVDEVRNFSIRAIIALPATKAEADGAGRSPNGFTGMEVRTDGVERIIISGGVTKVEGDTITLVGPRGEMKLTITPRSPVLRLAPAQAGDIAAGDRLATAEVLQEGAKPAKVLAGKNAVVATR